MYYEKSWKCSISKIYTTRICFDIDFTNDFINNLNITLSGKIKISNLHLENKEVIIEIEIVNSLKDFNLHNLQASTKKIAWNLWNE